MTGVELAQLVLLGIEIATAAAKGVPEAIAAKEAVERMIAEDRDPTPEEWGQLQAITDGYHKRIQAAAATTGGGGE